MSSAALLDPEERSRQFFPDSFSSQNSRTLPVGGAIRSPQRSYGSGSGTQGVSPSDPLINVTGNTSTGSSTRAVHGSGQSRPDLGFATRRCPTLYRRVDDYFHVTQLGSSLQREIIGGVSTFLVCIYILKFEEVILSDAGVPTGGVFAATCLSAGLGSIAMGALARVPIVVAPGMGMNVFFAHVMVNSIGITWQDALGMVFVQGLLLALLAFLGIRNRVLKAFGSSIRVGIAIGLVLFLAWIGLDRIDIAMQKDGIFVPSFRLAMGMGTMLLIVLLLVRFKMKSAFIVGMFVCTLVSIGVRGIWCPAELELDWSTPALGETIFALRFNWDARAAYLVPLLLFHHLFDSVATILSILQMAYLGFTKAPAASLGTSSSSRFSTVDEFTELLANSKQARNALIVDGLASSVGALLGVSTTTSYIESAIGVAIGARTGLCSIVAGLLFLCGLGLRPIFLLVPPEATGPVLLLTAVMTFPIINQLDLNNYMQSLPALFAAWVIPFTGSIGVSCALSYILEIISKVSLGKWRNPFMWLLGLLAVGEIVLYLILYIERDSQKNAPLIDLESIERRVGRTCNSLA